MRGLMVRGFRKAAAGLALLAVSCMPALADATVPSADIEGSADNALAKRYEGSFIVYHQKLDYTDFSVPLFAAEGRSRSGQARQEQQQGVQAGEG